MGKKSDAAKASLAVTFLAAGGTVTAQGAAATSSDNPVAVVSSYFGGLGLRDDFEHYVKLNTGFDSFSKFYKTEPTDATFIVIKFSGLEKVAPPPGFEDDGGDGGIG
jgi:hypothetical protein